MVEVIETESVADDPGVRREGRGGILREQSAAGRFVGPFDLRRTWQVLAGAVLIGVGIAVILLGYAGAAGAPIVEEQVPYVVSGGLFGLALVVVGGFLFWAHWLFRQYERNEYHQNRQYELSEQTGARLLAAVEALRVELRGGRADAPAAPSPNGGELVMTEKGTVVHQPGCPIVASKGTTRRVTAAESRAADYRPCQICEPNVVA